ncbi:MAG TPA: hypothetical protein VFG04_30860 [Planctomycetaceae bacterium]|nr:hypothetical protein [Planctomycetaceae bacterium]
MHFDAVPIDLTPWVVAGILIVLAALVAGVAFWTIIRKRYNRGMDKRTRNMMIWLALTAVPGFVWIGRLIYSASR